MKKNIIILFIFNFITAFFFAAKTPLQNKDFYSLKYPDLSEPEINEKAGINININFKKSFETVYLKGSVEYRKIKYDMKKKLHFCEYNLLSKNEEWKTSVTDNGNYFITRSGEDREG